LTERREIAAISSEWDALLARSRCNRAYSCSKWYLATPDLLPELHPLVLIAWREGVLAGIMPLWLDVGRKEAGFPNDYSDHLDIIAPDDKIILTNHSRPIGTLTAIDAKTGDIVGTAELEDTAPEGAAADGKGHIFVNNESKNTIQVIDVKTWKATASWPLAPCEGPTGIAYDKKTNRIFAGCNKTSVVVDATSGKVVASIANGTRVDALGWDPAKKLIYIPNGGEGNVTVVHQDSADKYTVVATVPTFSGAKTIAVDTASHNVFLFQPERGPAPAPAADAPAPAPGGGRGRGPQGPIVASWFIVITP